MSILKDDINYSALNFNKNVSKQLDDIYKPLENRNISTFAYFRFYEDGRYLYLCNDIPWVEHCLMHVQDNDTSLGQQINRVPQDGYHCYLWPTIQQDELLTALYNHNIWHGLSIFRQLPDSVELWGFAGTKEDINLPNLFVDDIELLKDYTTYFNQKANHLINPSDKSKFAIYKNHQPLLSEFEDIHHLKQLNEFIQRTNHNKHPIVTLGGKEIILSKRENECLLQLAFRKTSKEIANELKISEKTADQYIKNAKQKLACDTRSELIETFKKSALDWFK